MKKIVSLQCEKCGILFPAEEEARGSEHEKSCDPLEDVVVGMYDSLMSRGLITRDGIRSWIFEHLQKEALESHPEFIYIAPYFDLSGIEKIISDIKKDDFYLFRVRAAVTRGGLILGVAIERHGDDFISSAENYQYLIVADPTRPKEEAAKVTNGLRDDFLSKYKEGFQKYGNR